jgi:hypothetical protein
MPFGICYKVLPLFKIFSLPVLTRTLLSWHGKWLVKELRFFVSTTARSTGGWRGLFSSSESPPTHVTYRAEYVPAPRFCWCHAQLQSYLTRRCLASKRSQLWHRDDYTHRLGPRLSIAYPVAKNLRERAVHCSIRIPKQPKTDLIDPSHINRTRKFAVASFLVPSILNAIWIWSDL